jgi:predicted ABC-type ATPase
MKAITIIAGPNGSGKSTLAGQLSLLNYINADLLEKELYKEIADSRQREALAAYAMSRSIIQHLRDGTSFSVETVFAANQIPGFLVKARGSGYKIIVHFIATDKPGINIERVAERVRQGGHNVPRDKIVERYGKSIRLLPKLIEFADEITLYDNSGEKPRPFAVKENSQLKNIAECPNWAKYLFE